ncbi:hypothetical protein Taro_033878, partial [Colocasia esculenta]|nr:hypothetical protein [Colocasia esculenta]
MHSRSGSRVRRSRSADDVSGHSSQDSVARHHSVPAQALVPTTQGASSTTSASSSVAGKTFKDAVKFVPPSVDSSD